MAVAKKKARPRRAPAPKVSVVKLAELLADPSNAMKHPERNREAIRGSVRRFGAARSLVMDGQGVVRAGNGTLEGALEEGMEEALVVETDGSRLVVVKRPDWTAEEAAAYAIADNRIGQLAEWDYQTLAAALKPFFEADDLQGIGFEPFEVEPMIGANWRNGEGPGLGDFEPAPPPPKLVVRLRTDEEVELYERARVALELPADATTESVFLAMARRVLGE